jgi:excisionase family DNA binding protein
MNKNGSYLTTEQVAEILNVSSVTIQRMVARGHFPGTYKKDPTRKNSGFRIPRSAVEAFRQRQIVTPEETADEQS